jgi:glycosyltransferase involved in cell wall biosynthesis
MISLPIVGLATTELVTIVKNDVSEYINTNVDVLIEQMQRLIKDPQQAKRLGKGAREVARSRFNIHRFVQDWNEVFEQAVSLQVSA